MTQTVNNTAANTAEITAAAHLLDVYVDNDADIQANYVAAAITVGVDLYTSGRVPLCGLSDLYECIEPYITKAVEAAAAMVKRYDGLISTAADKNKAATSLADYIINDGVKFELQQILSRVNAGLLSLTKY